MAIVWASIFWLTGIFAGHRIPLLPIHWLVLSSFALLAAITLRKRSTYRSFFLLLMVFTLAGLRSPPATSPPNPSDLGYYNDLEAQARITGVVIDDPDRRENHTTLRVRAQRLIIPTLEIAKPIEGDVLVHASRYEQWSYGDWVRVKGELETPPQIDDFSYAEYLARKGIYSWVKDASVDKLGEGRGSAPMRWIFGLRQQFFTTIGKIFPEPEASLVAGILLGIETDIPDDLYEQFGRTGTTHIIAISGFNITLIANIIIALSRRLFGTRRGLWVAAAGISLYTVLVGADAAVVRAAVMGGLALAARYWGRDALGFASLAASGILMTLIDPMVMWDVGFQLSFMATLGLILYATPLHGWSVAAFSNWLSQQKAKQIGGLVAEFVLYTMAAQLTTWPLTLFYFRRFSFISFLANPIILPLQPGLMTLSGVAVLAGTFWLPLGKFLAIFAWPFSALTIRIVSLLSHYAVAGFGISGASLSLLFSYYAALFGGTIIVTKLPTDKSIINKIRPTASTLDGGAAWGLAIAGLATCFVWHSAAHSADGHLHLAIFDVGSGDAVLVQSPTGNMLLIDGGKSPSRLMNYLGYELPLLERDISGLVVAGTHTNQVAGLLGLTNHLEVENAFISNVRGSYSYRSLKEELLGAGIDIESVSPGQKIDIGGGANLEIIGCTDTGMILMVNHNHARILIPAGLSPETIETILDDPRIRDVSALLLPDGGHPSSNPRAWLETTNPRLAILSLSSTEEVSSHAEEVLAVLGDRTILRTDLHGSITIHTDGQVLWVETERRPAE